MKKLLKSLFVVAVSVVTVALSSGAGSKALAQDYGSDEDYGNQTYMNQNDYRSPTYGNYDRNYGYYNFYGRRIVRIRDDMYRPNVIVIREGRTVTWINRDDEPHTVTSDQGLFNSGVLYPGQRFSVRFSHAGVYNYHCQIHPEMHGRVVVRSGYYR